MMDFQALLSNLALPLFLVLIVVVMFFSTRKQRRTVAEQQKMQNSLTAGDRVMTTSGLYGTVVSTADDTIDLEIAAGVVTTWLRLAVREKVVADQAVAETDEAAQAPVAAVAEENAEATDRDKAAH